MDLKRILGAFGVVAAVLVAAPAGAILIPFDVLEGNSADSATLALQLEAEVLDAGGGQVSFEIFNVGPSFMGTPLNGIIAEVYWDDDGGLLDTLDTLPADWNEGASPPNVPGGNAISFDADASAQADNPAPQNGFNTNESGVFLFSYASGVDFDDIVAALGDGSLRLGLHVIATGDDMEDSDSFVNPPPPPPDVPEPATVGLMLMGLAGVAMRRKRGAKC